MNENDYKFVLKETSSTQIGARYSYAEALFHENIPFKFQSIIQLYILKEVDENKCIGVHLLELSEDDFCFRIYQQLKLKIQFYEPQKKGGFKMKSMKFDKFKAYQRENWTDAHFMQSFTLSNLALMAYTV